MMQLATNRITNAMNCRRLDYSLLAICVTFVLMSPALGNNWHDTFYQYRVPLETESAGSGWVTIPLTERQITDAINRVSRFKFDGNFFAYNAVALVEVDNAGSVIKAHDEAGFYLTRVGVNRAKDWKQAKDKYSIQVVKDKPHILDFVSSNFGKNPGYKYETIFPPGSTARQNDYRVSFFPPVLPREETRRKLFFVPDRGSMDLMVGGIWVGKLHELRVHEVNVTLRAKLDKPGRHRWMLYYQPMCSHHLQTPAHESATVPSATAKVDSLGMAEKYMGDTMYRLLSSDDLDVAFAETTVKLTRKMEFPLKSRKQIAIRAAANERQSFQVLLRAKRGSLVVTKASITDLRSKERVIASSGITIRRIEYVPIKQSSYITPAKFLGDVGDPLVDMTSTRLKPSDGVLGLWVTVNIPPGTVAGSYSGSLRLERENAELISIPLSLEVYGFELPEYSTFRSNLGMQYITKMLNYSREDSRDLLAYHGIPRKWPRDVPAMKRLARAYFDAMVENKFTPKSVALYSEIGMNWTPPPKGYNVDAPGNYFKLHDWDFTDFNKTLRHYIDVKKVNNVCLTHTDPSSCNLFQQLPGKRNTRPPRSAPHLTMAWHTFREITMVVYGKTKSDPYQNKSIEVTPKQWDHLVLNYYRKIAENLEKNGWLDKVHILIDETENPKRLQHFLGLLKSDPLTARIRTAACIQGVGLIQRKAPWRKEEFDFRGLLDIYVPEIDENYDRWMDYYWSDHELERKRDKLWPYLVTSSRLAIDTPGINNRITGLDIFNRGGSGLLIWETTGWDHLYGKSRNPWKDPYTRHANGSLAYFYPPKRDGVSKKPDFTITPSLRMETYREAVDDYEYARILEDLVAAGRKTGQDVSNGELVLRDLKRFFVSNTHWSQNDAWYLNWRDRAARAIVDLKGRK